MSMLMFICDQNLPLVFSSWLLYVWVSGFVVAIYITAILFKSNDILRKQTALKVCFLLNGLNMLKQYTCKWDQFSSFICPAKSGVRKSWNLWKFDVSGGKEDICPCWLFDSVHASYHWHLLVASQGWIFLFTTHDSSKGNPSFLACTIHHPGKRYDCHLSSFLTLYSFNYYEFYGTNQVNFKHVSSVDITVFCFRQQLPLYPGLRFCYCSFCVLKKVVHTFGLPLYVIFVSL